MTTSSFSAFTWYNFNSTNLFNYTISAGLGKNSNGATNMTPMRTYSSSENWQLFPQKGVYFIRNWDYGSEFQLGLSFADQSAPKLYARSGALGQQWTLKQVDGGWTLVNGLLGNGSSLVLDVGATAPVMKSGTAGVWGIYRNPSADVNGPKDTGMYDEVTGFEVATTSSSTVSSATSTLQTSAASASASTNLSVSSTPTNTSVANSSSSSSSSSLAPGAIAGIVIAGVAGLAIVIIAVWFLIRRQKTTKLQPHELDANTLPQTHVSEKYAYRAELESPGHPKQHPSQIVEMPS